MKTLLLLKTIKSFRFLLTFTYYIQYQNIVCNRSVYYKILPTLCLFPVLKIINHSRKINIKNFYTIACLGSANSTGKDINNVQHYFIAPAQCENYPGVIDLRTTTHRYVQKEMECTTREYRGEENFRLLFREPLFVKSQ